MWTQEEERIFGRGQGGRGAGGGRECKTCQLKGRIKKGRRDGMRGEKRCRLKRWGWQRN